MEGFNLYQAIGGTAACQKLSKAFYARVAKDPILRPLFPGKTFKCAIEEFSAFLVQLLTGPPEDTQRRRWLSLRESHLRFKIGQREKNAWMQNMGKALNVVQIAEPCRHAFLAFFEEASAYLVNTGPPLPTAVDDRKPPVDECIHQELLLRWDAQRALDETVAAVRAGELDRVLAMLDTPALRNYVKGRRHMIADLFGLMILSDHRSMLDYVTEQLSIDPGLTRERYSGRTLLHQASSAGNLTMVELLLNMGVDPNTKDAGRHTALYRVANDCDGRGGGTIVRALVRNGARVDACDGVKRCTPLHMAARRGNVDVAEALLDCGANLEARDSVGDTPLRRAVNCGKTEVADLLLSRGADRHSIGSKGLTPVSAARADLRRLLRTPIRE